MAISPGKIVNENLDFRLNKTKKAQHKRKACNAPLLATISFLIGLYVAFVE